MYRAACLLGVAACAAPAAQVAPIAPAAITAGASSSVPTRAHLCERAKALHAASCAPFDRMDAALLDRCTVADSLFIASAQSCVDAAGCDAVQACMIDVARTGAPYVGPTAPCAPAIDVPVGVTAAELDASYGRRDRTFADSPSTAAKPIEVCGMPAETGYLTRLTCSDGSHPFADRAAADGARAGSLGPGGRCGRTIDRYEVACPERAYEVFIDPYRCLAHG